MLSPVKLSYNVYSKGKELPTYEKTNTSPIVVVPGLFGSKVNWNSLSKSISSRTGRNVISIDVRNHGESEWSAEFNYDAMSEDVLALMKQLDIPKINFIGHSLGGRLAMAVTLSQPDKVEKLVVVDVSPVRMSPDSANLLYMIQKMKAIQFPNGVPMSQARKVADEELKAVASNPAIRQFLLTNIRENQDKTFQWRINLEAIEKGMPNIMHYEYPAVVCNHPTMFVAGEKSDYLKPDHHDEILKIFPKAVFHYLDAGHWLHAEKPGEFLSLVCPFLKI